MRYAHLRSNTPRVVLALLLGFLTTTTLYAQLPAASADQKQSNEAADLLKQLNQAASDQPATSQAASETATQLSPIASRPVGIDHSTLSFETYTLGFNASISTSSQHDSTSGWSNTLSPNVSWRFNRFLNLNAGIPVSTYIDVSEIKSVNTVSGVVISTDYNLVTRDFLFGDTFLSAELELHPHLFDYSFIATMGLPTGDYEHSLGSGQVTYNIDNHFERPIGSYLVPNIELGIGDTSALVNASVHSSYLAVGESAHFQAGLSAFFLRGVSFTSNAYEELPLGTQTVTTATTNGKKGKQLKVIQTTTQASLGEDNGFLNTLDVPLSSRLSFAAFYNRSLRNKTDIVGFSFTVLLRPATQEPK